MSKYIITMEIKNDSQINQTMQGGRLLGSEHVYVEGHQYFGNFLKLNESFSNIKEAFVFNNEEELNDFLTSNKFLKNVGQYVNKFSDEIKVIGSTASLYNIKIPLKHIDKNFNFNEYKPESISGLSNLIVSNLIKNNLIDKKDENKLYLEFINQMQNDKFIISNLYNLYKNEYQSSSKLEDYEFLNNFILINNAIFKEAIDKNYDVNILLDNHNDIINMIFINENQLNLKNLIEEDLPKILDDYLSNRENEVNFS